MNGKFATIVTTTLFLGIVTALPTFADILWDSGSFEPGEFGIVSDGGFPQYIAEDITISTPSLLTSATWWGFDGTTDQQTFQLSLYSVSAGIPSTVALANLPILPTQTDTGFFAGSGESIYRYTITGLAQNLPAGDYAVSLVEVAGSSIWNWMPNSAVSGSFHFREATNDPWQTTTGKMAFQLAGSAVPEWGTLSSFVLGCGLLKNLIHRRNRNVMSGV